VIAPAYDDILPGPTHFDVASYAYLVEHDPTWYDYAPLHRRYKRGRRGCCFSNALMLSLTTDDGLVYVEGLAGAAADDVEPAVWVHHGWCVSPDGRVVDPTWRPSEPGVVRYYGVVLGLEDLRRAGRAVTEESGLVPFVHGLLPCLAADGAQA
jgi:hypothetical protein